MRQLSDCLPLFLDWKFAHLLRSDFSLVRILHFHSVGIFLCWNFAFSLGRDFFLAKTLHVHSAEICGLSVQLLPINIHCCVHILRLHYFPFLFCKAMYCCKYLQIFLEPVWHVGMLADRLNIIHGSCHNVEPASCHVSLSLYSTELEHWHCVS